MAVQKVTDAQFETEVINSALPVLIDFYADWCQPCKAIAPLVEDVAKRYAGRLKVVKVDVDANPAAAQAFQVRSIPTLAFVHDRQILDVIVGAVDRTQLEERVARFAAPGSAAATCETWDAQRVALGIESGTVVALDVRVEGDFTRARIPGAVNIPREQLADRVAELASDPVRWALYARTDEGLLDIGNKLAEGGLQVCVLEGGFLAWESEMLPVKKG